MITERIYAETVADTFIRLRGNGLVLSSMDTQLIQSWWERGVPLPVVLTGIEEVMGNHQTASGGRKVRSLSYCTEEIEAAHAEWLTGRVGAHE